jgi:hypothetical protein
LGNVCKNDILHFLTCSIIIGNTPSLRSQDIDILRQSWCNGRLQNLIKFWILLYYVTLLGRYKSEYTEIQYSGVINSISKWIAYTSYFILPTTATRGLSNNAMFIWKKTKRRMINKTQTSNDRATQSPFKTVCELRSSEKVNSFCSISDTRPSYVTHVKNPMISQRHYNRKYTIPS